MPYVHASRQWSLVETFAGGKTDACTCAGAPGGVVLGGNRIHFLEPLMTAFHADVPFGSTWKDDPDLVGPTMSHLRQHSRHLQHGWRGPQHAGQA